MRRDNQLMPGDAYSFELAWRWTRPTHNVLPPEAECEHEMFVTIRWGKKGLAAPLVQMKPLKGS